MWRDEASRAAGAKAARAVATSLHVGALSPEEHAFLPSSCTDADKQHYLLVRPRRLAALYSLGRLAAPWHVLFVYGACAAPDTPFAAALLGGWNRNDVRDAKREGGRGCLRCL